MVYAGGHKVKTKRSMTEKLRNLKVDRKLKKSFSTLLIAFVMAAVFAIGGLAMIHANIKRFYNESYQNMALQLEIRKDIQLTGKYVLWAITVTDEEREKILRDVTTYAKRVEDNVYALEASFSDKEMTAALDAALQTLKAERVRITEMLEAGDNAGAAEAFNGTYNDATENIQDILLEIGEAADAQAITAYSRISDLVPMVYIIMILVAAISVWLCTRLSGALTGLLLTPIRELQGAARQLKAGELAVEISSQNEDELGELAQDFQAACTQMRLVIEDMGDLLSKMAEGKFNIHTQAEEEYVGDFALLIDSIRKMNHQLNTTLLRINEASKQVMVGSGQLASSAQSLAEGAAEQAASVQKLLGTIGEVTNISESSAESADTAASNARESAENAEKSKEEINALMDAMKRINDTSREIENIITAIEDIASQTNLLSLNASIEAARAGEAGKGFAVVADQIGKLAADSAQSAVTTRELISKSLIEIEQGNQIAEQTMESIASVLESMFQLANMAAGAADASKSQATMLKEVEQGIEQISTVVESNSATAQETSAISEELSAQAQTLEQMVNVFELREE